MEGPRSLFPSETFSVPIKGPKRAGIYALLVFLPSKKANLNLRATEKAKKNGIPTTWTSRASEKRLQAARKGSLKTMGRAM